MYDNYDEFDEMDDEYQNDDYISNDIYFHETFMSGAPVKELYFFEGTYKIRTVSSNALDDDIHIACIIEPSGYGTPNKSLIDVYECFENTYLLEFLITIICNSGIINIDKCKKLISIKDKKSCIYVTASLSTNQKYCKLEDEIESDQQATDIITIGGNDVMRTHQIFYVRTQAIKYAIVRYDSYGKGIDWTSDKVDWSRVYSNFIEPYILTLMNISLKVNNCKNAITYKEYMTFHAQFAIVRTKTALYAEIYILPKTVFGHRILYNMDNGRKIYISTLSENAKDKLAMNSDEFRLCAGSQNLNLLPLNVLNLKHIFDNGQPFVVLNELPTEEDLLINRIILERDHYTECPQDFVIYLDKINGVEPFTLSIDNDHSGLICYYGFVDPNSNKCARIDLNNTSSVIGVISIALNNDINYDKLSHTIIEKEEISYLPWNLYKSIFHNQKIHGGSTIVLTPIRALPKYREYMVTVIIDETNDTESQSDIINKKEDSCDKPRKRWFNFGK